MFIYKGSRPVKYRYTIVYALSTNPNKKFEAEREGIYFGQCSELCGLNHAYMPITVKVVSEEAYAQWLVEAKEEYAGIPQDLRVASN